MGDDFSTTGNGNWWKVSSSSSSSPSSSSGIGCGTLGRFGWERTETVEVNKERSSSIESGGSVVFHDHHKLHHDPSFDHHHHHHHHLQMIRLGLSSQPAHQWNQSLLRDDNKAQTSFGAMLQENINANANADVSINATSSYQQESGSSPASMWRDSAANMEFKAQMSDGSGFFLDQSRFSQNASSSDSTVTCQSFAVENSSNALYSSPNSSNMFQGTFLGSNQPRNQSPFSYSQYGNFGMSSNNNDHMASASASATATWFLRASPPQKPQSPLSFSNNAPFWNPSDASPNFFPALQTQPIQTPNFDEKPKNVPEIPDPKRSGGDQPAAKRSKNETVSPSPTFKVRKEKMGDRIAALQQLVSPFGKTDAASVLSEAIEYIKFLHQQVTALSSPYIKSGPSLQHPQNRDQSRDREEPEQDLRSRGLCLVPVSSTFPITHDTTVDFWTPTFGGSFR
ncbi:PREDICTED: transcription factor bHLH123 isoform X2 [Tarenaya hassleriana]|uniref:transcription factor bHLH123 isoform X2 n=1 Tax=Tarenaya hassleriana TaxID=28532 RepID=UPI00053C8528|nr:PREDICTED: transcription factor bHLH123 isoform X2 [Tarenaya hassleriana]